jgi:tyrosine-protein kinase Etk/Wzc
MTPTQPRLTASGAAGGAAEPTVLDLAALALRRRRLVLGSMLVMTLLAGLYAFSRPRTWTSGVVVVPSASGGDSRGQVLASQLGLAALAGRVGGGGSGQSVPAIMKSKALRDSVSAYMRASHQTTLSRKALDKLLKRATSVGTDQATRAVSIDVTTTDPHLSQRLASAFPAAVNAIASRTALDAASHRREILERQIQLARQHLVRSQRALLTFQEQTGAPQIQEQARQTVAAGAELQRTITQQELKVAQLSRVSTPDNPEYRAAAAQLATLRGQLRRLTNQGSEVFLSGRALPGVQLEMAQRLRDYTTDEQIYTMLTSDLVDAQLDLRNDLEVVSVLDATELPDRPSGPHRILLLLAGMILGSLLGLFLAYCADYLARARDAGPDEPFFSELKRLRGGGEADRAGAA